MKINIEYKSVLSEFKNIEKRNYAFNNLDAQSQRLEIAWDALNIVLQNKVNASNGYYWGKDLQTKVKTLNPKQTQNFLLKKLNQSTCNVCQRGLMMMSQIRLGNELCSKDDNYIDMGNENNIKGFSIQDFQKMELEYERSEFEHPYNRRTEQKLANICCNVLMNGNFNIDDSTDYLTY